MNFFAKYMYFSRIFFFKETAYVWSWRYIVVILMDTEQIWKFFLLLKSSFSQAKQTQLNYCRKKSVCNLLAYVVNNNYTVAYFSIVFGICVFYNFRIIQIAATIGISLTGSCIIDTRLFLLLMKCLKKTSSTVLNCKVFIYKFCENKPCRFLIIVIHNGRRSIKTLGIVR